MKYSMPIALVLPLLVLVTGCGAGAAEDLAESIADQVNESLNAERSNSDDILPEDEGETVVLASGGADSSDSNEEISSLEPAGEYSRLSVSWDIPELRENGDVLEISEIGGYQLRFTHIGSGDEYIYEVNDPTVDQVAFQLDVSYLNAAGTWQYQILAFDAEGVLGSYSDAQEVVMN